MIREYFSPALQFFGTPPQARRRDVYEEHDDRAADRGDESVFDDDRLDLEEDVASLDDDVISLDDDEMTVE